MTGLSKTTADARSLIAAVAAGDIVLRCSKGNWRSLPARMPQGKGAVLDNALVARLISAELLETEGDGAIATARGRRFCGVGDHTIARKGRVRKPARTHKSVGPGGIKMNTAESPVAWLRSRKDSDGNPLLGDAAFRAAEKLRADYTHAGMTPRMSVNLESVRAGRGRKNGTKGPADAIDAALTARARVRSALAHVGGDLSGLLFDVCCELKSLGAVETERGWPKRSAKVVLDIALARLADHYGYADEARGHRRAKTLSHWGVEDYRPNLE